MDLYDTEPGTQDAQRKLGIRVNLGQFALQLLQVSFVGLTLGMVRTVVPALAESEFGLQRNAPGLVGTFVVAFGIVKAAMNFTAGALSERLGRKHVLVLGWLIALPIPFMIRFGPNWSWIIAATALLGVNQGLTWSMTLTSKLDLTRADQRGLANGLNEFCGYFAVAVAGVLTAAMADALGPRIGLFIFGLAVIVPATAIALTLVKDTRAWTRVQSVATPNAVSSSLTTAQVIQRTWRDPQFFAICQAGLVEKFTDALIWIYLPYLLVQRGVDLAAVGWIPGVYAACWGFSQMFTGPLSDRVGRLRPIVSGMMLCAIGVGWMAMSDAVMWWAIAAAITGLGMALLYPTLGAAISDLAQPAWRGAALGVYRFWRDLGYAVGAVAISAIVRFTDGIEAGFWLASAAMAGSALVLWFIGGQTQPRRKLASAGTRTSPDAVDVP